MRIFRLIFYISLFVFSENALTTVRFRAPSPSAMALECPVSCRNQYLDAREQAIRQCEAEVANSTLVQSCTRADLVDANIASCIDECQRIRTMEVSCAENGGIVMETTNGIQYCERCPENTTPQTSQGVGGVSLICNCPAGSDRTVIGPHDEFSECGVNRTTTNCDVHMNPITGELNTDAPFECTPEGQRQTQVNQQRQENESAAQSQARQSAQDDLNAAIETARSSAISSCNSLVDSFVSQCSSVSAQAPPNENINSSSAASAEQCRSMQRSSESVISQVETQVQECLSSYSSLSGSCPESTGPLTGKGSATVSTGQDTLGSEVVATVSDVSATGSGAITENSSRIQEAESVVSNLNSLSSQVSREMNDIKQQADQCIAAFEEDPDNGGEANDWTGVAQTAVDAFSKLNSDAGFTGSSELGGGGGGFAAASPGFTGTDNYSSDSTFSRDTNAGFNGGGGNTDFGVGKGDDPSSVRGNNGNAGSSNRGGLAGMGMPIGAGVANSGAQNSGATPTNSNRGPRRSYASANERNLVLGYKKAKSGVAGGSGSLTYHPDDLKKYGKDEILRQASEARDKFGKDTPLLFKNGRFVRDYLEMKNRLAWRRHNIRQRNRLSGVFNSQKEQEAKSFHQCAIFGECYTEERYDIFRLHHFRAIKLIGE